MADGSIRVVTKLDNSQLKQQIKELERELNNIRKEQGKLDAQMDGTMAKYQAEREFDSQFPEEFSHREEIDARAAKELDPIIAKQEELNQKEQQYLAMLDTAKAKLAEQANIASASKQVDDAVKGDAAMGKVQSQAQYNSLLDATAAKMAAIEAAAGQVAAQTGLTKEQILAANPQYQKLSDTMGTLKAKAADFGNEAKDAGKKASKAMKQAGKDTKKVGDETKRGIAGFGKMQLMMMGIMMATRAISAATQEYMATNSKLEGQLNTLKSLWGQVLGPVIEWVINLLIKAVSAVNAFVYALTGINFVARANEAALKKQAKAAGAAQGASFDEQNKVGGGSSDNPVTLLDSSVDNISQKLRELIENGDWYGAGKNIGQSLMDGIGDMEWVDLGNKIGEILGNVIGFSLGFFLQLDPATINGAINGFVGGLLQGLSNALQNVDWVDVGKNLLDLFLWGLALSNPVTAILSILLSPNGDELLAGAAEFIGTIISALLQAIVGSAWRIGELASELWTSLKGYFDEYVNWEGTPGEIIQGLWDGLVAALVGVGRWIDENLWHPFAEGFVDCIDWDDPAVQVIEGLFVGIADACCDMAQWIFDNIWVPFEEGFKEAFGIHSPSTKMKSFGGDIIAGLKNGITEGITKVKNTCKEIWAAVKGVFSSVGTWFKDKFKSAGSNISSGFTSSLSKIKKACSQIWSAIKDVFRNVTSWFKEKFTSAWTSVKNVFSKGGKIFDGIKEGISSTFKNIVNGLIDGINKIIRTPFNAINSMLNTIRSKKILGVQPFYNLWSYNPLSIPQIPKLALGGIVNRPGRGVPAIIGEAGAEAVLPLENNTEWMDILADKIGGGTITIPITLDGKRIATYIVDIQKKKAFAMNGA